MARALAYAGVPSRALTLEITETSLMTEPERAIEALVRLRELGVRLSVDDLGTGYSSLAYLQRLPVDEIKIDRTFVFAFPDPSAQAVVGAIVELGHRLGHRVVAEGVEDEAAYLLLDGLGCDSAQGYWLARPQPADRLTGLLATWSAPRPQRLRQVPKPKQVSGSRGGWRPCRLLPSLFLLPKSVSRSQLTAIMRKACFSISMKAAPMAPTGA